jgi:hypothetical protein
VVYFAAGPPSPGNSETQRAVRRAGQIYACLRGKGLCDVTLDEKVVASAVLAEWVQSHDAPDAVWTLDRALARAGRAPVREGFRRPPAASVRRARRHLGRRGGHESVVARRFVLYGAAQESNLPSRGLHDRTGFEDQLGHRAHAAP